MGGKFNARQRSRGDLSRKFKAFKNSGFKKHGKGNGVRRDYRQSNNKRYRGELDEDF